MGGSGEISGRVLACEGRRGDRARARARAAEESMCIESVVLILEDRAIRGDLGTWGTDSARSSSGIRDSLCLPPAVLALVLPLSLSALASPR